MIDQARPGMKFVRIVISPDPKKEDARRDLRMREVTIETIGALTKRQGRVVTFIAAVHDDHTDIRHIHVIALVDKRLTVKDFQLLRAKATKECQSQRQLLDVKATRARHWQRTISTTLARGTKPPGIRRTTSEYEMVSPSSPSCPDCGMGQPLKRIPGGQFWCPSCRLRMRKEGLQTVIEKKELTLERGYG
jgi:ribosomal protein L37AE/L43A